MSSPLDGLASGLSTTQLINQLIQLEKQPQERLVAKKANAQKVITALQAINAKMVSVRSLAGDVAKPSSWQAMSATSSADAVVTASAGANALAGTLSFNVASLASTGSKASSGTVSTTSAVVTSGNLLLATGGRPLGIEGVKTGAGLVLGDHDIEVTQASAGAVKTGAVALAASTVIGAGNKTITLNVNGAGRTYTLAEGTYDRTQLAAAVQTASGGEVTATVDGTNKLVLTSVAEGSQATLQITGGTAIADLQLAVDGGALAGTDAIIDVEGTLTTVDFVAAGQTKTLTSGAGGQLSISMAGGLRKGEFTATAVSTGGGTLTEVVNAINNANKGISAAAVQVAPSTFRLQLSAKGTGLAKDLTISNDAISGMSSLASTSTAADAVITVGSGAGAYSISSASNVVNGTIPGVNLTLKSVGAATVTVARDANKLADKLNSLVTAANSAMTDIKTQTAFNSQTETGALLMGNFTVRSLQQKISTAIIDPVVTSLIGSAGRAGVSVTKTGGISFDRAEFLAKYAEDPAGVEALFVQGGQADESTISLASAHDKTRAGTYAVTVSAAATQAEKAGNVLAGGTITLAETISVRLGGLTGTVVSYAASAGESLTSIADELNERLSEAKFGIVATVEANKLVLRTNGYGTGSKFEVKSSVTGAGQASMSAADDTYQQWVGTDVAGTINGIAATGSGQLLSAPAANSTIGGLVLKVTATAADVTALAGDFGDFKYVPGVAQRLASVGYDAVDEVTGSISAVVDGRTTEITNLTQQISRWDTRIATKEKALRRQFAAMEVALQQMNSQSQWLAGQIQSINANAGIGRSN